MIQDPPLKGYFKLVKHSGGHGYFAEVTLLVYPAAISSIERGPGLRALTPLFAGAMFGVTHALEVLPPRGYEPRGTYRVEITEIKFMPCDTTPAQVLYAAANAVFNAFGVPGEPVTLDLVTGSVVILSQPKLP